TPSPASARLARGCAPAAAHLLRLHGANRSSLRPMSGPGASWQLACQLRRVGRVCEAHRWYVVLTRSVRRASLTRSVRTTLAPGGPRRLDPPYSSSLHHGRALPRHQALVARLGRATPHSDWPDSSRTPCAADFPHPAIPSSSPLA